MKFTSHTFLSRQLALGFTSLLLAGFVAIPTRLGAATPPPKPLRALLVLGGCCHDYTRQMDILKKGLEARAHVQVEFVFNPDTSTKARYEVYEKPDWAKGYDVIIHDECSADVKELDYVQGILAAHKAGVPAVTLHCAMHSFRTGTEDWFKFLGLQSASHGPQLPIQLKNIAAGHPIMKGWSDWTTINEELYNNLKVFETATPLISGKQVVKQKDGTEKDVEYIVAWVNQYGKTRVFNTTVGHNNDTVADARYLDLVTRGLLWSCDKLNNTYLKPVSREKK